MEKNQNTQLLYDELKRSIEQGSKNEADFVRLAKAAERIQDAAFEVPEFSTLFKTRLQERILEARHAASPKFSWKRLDGFVHMLFKLPRWQPVVATIVLVAIVVTSVQIWPFLHRTNPQFAKLFIDTAYAEDNFTVEPTNADSIGISTDSSFIIKSKQAIDVEKLKKNLIVLPTLNFDLQKISDHEFKIVAKESLKDKTLYRIFITASYVNAQGLTIDRPYSWAFQVRDIFGIRSTLPAHHSSGVPLNTGIEITFTHDNVANFEKNFSIEPRVEGAFERKGRTMIFIPSKPLLPGTIYNVKLNKDIGISGSTSTLQRDEIIQFETSAGQEQTKGVGRFTDQLVQFGTANQPALPVFLDRQEPWSSGVSNSSSPKAEIEVYRFSTITDFAVAFDKNQHIPGWAEYRRSTYLTSTSTLARVSSFFAPVQTLGYQSYLVFPEPLPAGLYLVHGRFGNKTSEAFLQITDLSTYITVSKTKTLLWANNIKSGGPVSRATLSGITKEVFGTTDAQGIATFNTDDLFGKPSNSSDSDSNAEHYFILQSGSASLLVRASKYEYDDRSEAYWKYLYTDRQLYQSNDVVHYWGFIKSRQKNEKSPVRLKVTISSYQVDDYISEEVDVNELGGFSGSLKLDYVKSGYYRLHVYDGQVRIVDRGFSVENYVKPAYQIQVVPNKRAIYSSEKVSFDIKASFFEGTPVSNLPVKYTFGDYAGTITLDAQGKGMVDMIPEKVCKTCSYPMTRAFTVVPVKSEEGSIQGSVDLRVFDSRITIEAGTQQLGSGQAKLSVKANLIDLTKINTPEGFFYDDYKGVIAPNTPVSVSITEISYNKIPGEQMYDFINKKTITDYRYEEVSKVLPKFDGTTNAQGIFEHDLVVEKGKSYQIGVTARDAGNRSVSTFVYHYTPYLHEQDGYADEFYSVGFGAGKDMVQKFKIGEKVQVLFSQNGRELPANSTGKFLFMRTQQGIVDYTITSDSRYDFTFSADHVPNVSVSGVWFDGRVYYTSPSYDVGTIVAKYDPADKALQFSVASDKPKYNPGDQVSLKIEVKNKTGQPIKTALNLNLVDEAFYQTSYEIADPVGELYASVSNGIYYNDVSHKYLTPNLDSAGGKGCFLEDTKIMMADRTERSIQDVQIGDTILTYKDEFLRELVPAKVLQTYRHVVAHYLIVNNQLFVTPEHRIFVNGTWRQIGEAEVGDWLLDAQGNHVEIKTIERRHALVRVYNLQVEKYHTFIANGIYVHNTKDGERQNFVDTAFFTSVQTDVNGQAQVSFKLPDNITSWRVTAQGISPDLYAGVVTAKIPVSLPLFADITAAKEYVVTDEPIIKIRAYGENLKSNDVVNFSFESKSLSATSTPFYMTGTSFDPLYIPLSTLREGDHKITASASTTQNSDVVSRMVRIIPSRVAAIHREYSTLQNGHKPQGSPNGRTDLFFTNGRMGQVYYDLLGLSYVETDRVDERVAELISLQVRKNYFKEDVVLPDDTVWQKYQNDSGGITLLPYSSDDLTLSAKIAFADLGVFDKMVLKNYFYKILGDSNSSKEDLAKAYLGLASLNEPVLIDLQTFAKISDLSPHEKLYLAWALLAAGDGARARSLYYDVLKHFAVENKPYIKISVGKDEEVNSELTAVAAIIGAGLNDQYHDGLLSYIEAEPTVLSRLGLERALLAKEILPFLNADKAGFMTVINGKKDKYTIPFGGFVRLSVTPSELSSMSFDNISGEVTMVSSFFAPPSSTKVQANSSIGLRREFYVNEKKTTLFKEVDLVEVRLYPRISSTAMRGRYQITDFVPSGLKIITSPYLGSNDYYNAANLCSFRYPYEVDGQVIKYSIDKEWLSSAQNCKNNDYISYYARVVTPGVYTAEPSIIEHFTAESIKNYSTKERITIIK